MKDEDVFFGLKQIHQDDFFLDDSIKMYEDQKWKTRNIFIYILC